MSELAERTGGDAGPGRSVRAGGLYEASAPDGFFIRQAGVADAPALALTASATMLESYAHLLPGADILAHCLKHHTADAYAAILADPANTLWLAQTRTGAIIGYLLLIPATLPEKPEPGDFEILRLYVLGRYHGAGLGRALMDTALGHAASCGARRVVLGVLGVNAPAVAFYGQCGFEQIDTRIFQVGQTICDDLVLARPIWPGVRK